MSITIRIDRIEFEAESCSLRLTGRNIEENEFVKMGQYHTVDVEIGQPVTLQKRCWDVISLERLQEASDPAAKADMAAIVMQEGLAHVCLVTSSMTVTRARIERRLPKKGQVSKHTHSIPLCTVRLIVCNIMEQINQAHSKAMQKFFEEVFEAVKKHINFDIVRVVLVGRCVSE
jgi:protein pelota